MIPKDIANQIYDLLKEHVGASEYWRDDFVFSLEKPLKYSSSEFRFQGNLDFGGKFRRSEYSGWYVDFYKEDETPEKLENVKKVNILLKALKDKHPNIV